MPNYRRYRVPGGCYFFTLNLLERHLNDLFVRHIALLRAAVDKKHFCQTDSGARATLKGTPGTR